MYENMAELPKPDSPMESLMLMVWRMRQDIEIQRTRLLVDAIIVSNAPVSEQTPKILREAWADYLNEILPFRNKLEKGQDETAMDYLKREVAKGPLRVVPLQPLTKSRKRKR